MMDGAWPASKRPLTNPMNQDTTNTAATSTSCNSFLSKKINSEKDLMHFKTKCPAFKDTLTFINLLCDKIYGTSNKVLNHKYTIQSEIFQNCSNLLDELAILCDETDLKQPKGAAPLRFGHIAFRDWFDAANSKSREFINTNLAPDQDEQLREELVSYLTESFGNRMRIDYGTGHELNFIIFSMGLSCLVNLSEVQAQTKSAVKSDYQHDKTINATPPNMVTTSRLKTYVEAHGWDILALYSHKYLRLCRRVQMKFRLEPAGSRGVYNMDDFQYLPFMFGAAQLANVKYVPVKDFYSNESVDMFKNDFIFLEAIDFILHNKRGPFHEHSYTLWLYMDLKTWDNMYRRIRTKFTDDVLTPFPIVQHLLFGNYILRWQPEDEGDH